MCAWRQGYLDGKPTSAPAPVAGRDGTQITVEDLFYNVPSRLRAFKSPAEEYGKILDVVGRYACHCETVAFSCKKYGDSYPALTVAASSKPLDRIRAVYGTAVAAELVPVQVPPNERYGFQGAQGMVTNPNYSAKKAIAPVLFINHRSVGCDPLRKALNGVYSAHLPRGGHSFVYMALDIDARNLDVNVHPTKRDVRFLYEDEIIEHICDAVQEALAGSSASRTFQTQTVFPGSRSAGLLNDQAALATPQKRAYEYNLVRTDSKQAKLTTLFASPGTPFKIVEDETTLVDVEDDRATGSTSQKPASTIPLASQFRQVPERVRVDVRLKSVQDLRSRIEAAAHEPLTRVFADHTYIGVVDYNRRLSAFQQGVRMFIVDYGVLSQELFYQAALADFGNFGTLTLQVDEEESDNDDDQVDGLSLKRLLGDTVKDAEGFLGQLWDMHEMLKEYFSISLVRVSGDHSDDYDLKIETLPMLVKGYIPPFAKLPSFVHALATQVGWDSEQECLDGVARALAKFYTPEPIPQPLMTQEGTQEGLDEGTLARQQEIGDVVERVIFPAVKQRLLAPKWLADHVVEIANLPGLYKVFERC